MRMTSNKKKIPARFFLSSWSTFSSSSKDVKYLVNLKTLNRRSTRRKRRSMPGKITCKIEGRKASKSTIARGLRAYLILLFSGDLFSVSDSTQDHRRNEYSSANITVETISMAKNCVR